MDFDNIQDVLKELKKSQSADRDRREAVREINSFLNDPDGMWEPEIYNKLDGRPRYTFDVCNPVVENIWGEMAQNDFDLRIKPAGEDASKESAMLLDGIIRNIETVSNAAEHYASTGKKGIQTGFAAVRIMQDWGEGATFDQDLTIKEVNNAVDRVWFDAVAEQRTMEDARFCFVLSSIGKDEYEKKYGSDEHICTSLPDERSESRYEAKAKKLIIGEFLCKKEVKEKIYLLNNGMVVNDDQLQQATMQGLTVAKERELTRHVVYSRKFDGKRWLTKSEKTVFDLLPVIPLYANFQIIEDKVIYWGAIEHLMDAQRVYNYVESRKVEEVALAPRPKLMMTRDQAKGNEKSLSTMNTNASPVQLYQHVEGQPAPYQTAGPQVNAGLSEVSQSMAANIERSSGVFGVNPSNNTGLQSDIALERLENRGQVGTYQYFKAQETMIRHVGKVAVRAIPKTYDANRMVRTMNEDGSFEMVEINGVQADQYGQMQPLNDVSQGVYDVTCDVGPAFKNRQQEAVKAIVEYAGIDPTILQEGGDILLGNISAPSMDKLAERKRHQMVLNGLIPDQQLTEEELAMMQQIRSKPPEKTPSDLIAEAEINKTMNEAAKIEADIQLQAEKQEAEQEAQIVKLQIEQNKQVTEQLKAMAQTLETLKNAMGADAIMSPVVAQAYEEQAAIVQGAQNQLEQ